MTSNVKLLPLPEPPCRGKAWEPQYREADMRAYARACVAHATAAKDAEIAHERWLRERAEDRCVAAEDQREALRELVQRWVIESNWRSGGVRATYKRCADELEAALAQAPAVGEVVASLRNAALLYEDGSCTRSNLITAALLVERIAIAQQPAEAFDPSIHPIPGEGRQPAAVGRTKWVCGFCTGSYYLPSPLGRFCCEAQARYRAAQPGGSDNDQ